MTMAANPRGTRFRVFCQPRYLPGWEEPELVVLSPEAGSVTAGPKDDRIEVVDAIKKELYDDDRMPPYDGRRHAAAAPDPAGHFHTLDTQSREFQSAHAYAVLRMVLDIWENYSGTRVRWFFAEDYPRLEVIPWVKWENGQAGYGFIELGFGEGKDDKHEPFALNFDVLAHEMGHILLASEVGIPWAPKHGQYAAFQEAASDLVALVCALHFDRLVDHVLRTTSGNLYAPNELNRLAELSDVDQIRTASHGLKMSDLDFQWQPTEQLSQKQIHQLGQPLTAAMFDVLVEVFHSQLVIRGAISADLDEAAHRYDSGNDQEVREGFLRAYAKAPDIFRESLIFARDFLGARLVKSWRALDADHVTLFSAAASFLTTDRQLTGMTYQELILDCLRWREFEPNAHQ